MPSLCHERQGWLVFKIEEGRGVSINGQTLIAWGFEPGAWFKEALPLANRLAAEGVDEAAIRAALQPLAPPVYERLSLRPSGAVPVTMNIRADDPEEAANIESVAAHMRELVRLPTVVAAAVMPDACPAGAAKGTIPVGGVVAAKDAIHPGMHSADICCSMAISVIGDLDPKAVLDLGMTLSHFGPGGRRGTDIVAPPAELLARFETNPFLRDLGAAATEHFATQGDGNHFFYVGRRGSTGEVALVTHHGSRRPGAELYKRGLAAAERLRVKIAPEVAPHNAWIPASSSEGEAYWEALQLVPHMDAREPLRHPRPRARRARRRRARALLERAQLRVPPR
jgi:tRNA-splicing ligase RtcB